MITPALLNYFNPKNVRKTELPTKLRETKRKVTKLLKHKIGAVAKYTIILPI